MIPLEILCLRVIIKYFELFYFAFTVSTDINIQRKLKFLKRRFSDQMLTALHFKPYLDDKYFAVFINKHLNFLAGKWVKNRTNLKSLDSLFCRLPNLTRICFRQNGDEILENVAKFCPKIIEIDLRHSDVTNNGLEYLYEMKNGMLPCPDLKNIFIRETSVTDSGVQRLLLNVPSLERIEYENVPLLLYSIYKKKLPYFKEVYCYNLVELKLTWLRNLSYYTDVLKTCLAVCPKLKSIACYVFKKEQLNLLTNSNFNEVYISFMMEESKINLEDFLKNIGRNLTILKICDTNLSRASCSMFVCEISTLCPILKEFYVHNVTFKETTANNLQVYFPCLTKCCFSHIDPASSQAISLFISSSPKLKALSLRFMFELPPNVIEEILKWCERPTTQLIEFVFMNLEVEFISNILLNSPSLKMMFLFQCMFNVQKPYKVLKNFLKKQSVSTTIFYRKFTCSSDMCEIHYMRGFNSESLFREHFPSYDYYLMEEYIRPNIYDSLFHETAFDEVDYESDEDWEDNWGIM